MKEESLKHLQERGLGCLIIVMPAPRFRNPIATGRSPPQRRQPCDEEAWRDEHWVRDRNRWRRQHQSRSAVLSWPGWLHDRDLQLRQLAGSSPVLLPSQTPQNQPRPITIHIVWPVWESEFGHTKCHRSCGIRRTTWWRTCSTSQYEPNLGFDVEANFAEKFKGPFVYRIC